MQMHVFMSLYCALAHAWVAKPSHTADFPSKIAQTAFWSQVPFDRLNGHFFVVNASFASDMKKRKRSANLAEISVQSFLIVCYGQVSWFIW